VNFPTVSSPRLCSIFVAALCLSIVGCSANAPSTSSIAGGQLRGSVHGGQQPVSGASVKLYAVGHTGYGSAATSLLTSVVTSGTDGSFSITGDYVCPSSSSQLYIVATGGNPGVGANNPALALMTALGPCSVFGGKLTLDPNGFISINEVTTVASVYALGAFMGADAAHVGTSNTNAAGISNAIGLVNNLVDTTGGTAFTTTFAGNGTVPQATINTLGNILATCVNSDGTGTPCGALFAAAAPVLGTTPTDTIQAIFDVARNPAHNVSTLYGLASSTPPFQPTLSSAPNDWTIQLAYITVKLDSTGAGASQSAIAIDSSGGAWIANAFTTSQNTTSSVSELSNNGSILSGNVGFTGGGLNQPNSIAIDPLGNVWLANNLSSNLVKFSNGGSALSGSGFASCGGTTPGLAIDGSGNVWCGGLSKFDNSGNLLSGSGYTGGGISYVRGISVDTSENAWLANASPTPPNFASSVSKFNNAGTAISSSTGYTSSGLTGAWSIANDNAGNAWVANNGATSSVFELGSDGTILSGSGGYTGGGVSSPMAIAVDGAGSAWVTSDVSSSSGIYSSVVEFGPGGTVLSGATGFALTPTGTPVGDAVDGSGNLWVAMSETNVIEMVGVATPVVTPLSLGVKNGTLGTKP